MPAQINLAADETQPAFAIFELPAAEADVRSKYLAQGFLVFLALVFLAGSVMIMRWSNYAVSQQSVLWQTQLSQAAYADARHIQTLINARLKPWQRWTQANSIRLTLMQALDGASPEQKSARRYIDSALALAAQRDGVYDQPAPSATAVVANDTAQIIAGPGAVLVARDGRKLSIVGSGYQVEQGTRPRRSEPSGAVIYGPYTGGKSPHVLLSFVIPIRAVQAEQTLAQLHVTFQLDADFLRGAGQFDIPAFAADQALIHPISSAILDLSDSTPEAALRLRYAPNFAGDQRFLWAVTRPENGAAVVAALEGGEALVAAHRVPESQWVAVRSVPADRALAAIKRRTLVWLLGGMLALSLACGLTLYAWRRGVEQRAHALSASRQAANQALSRANAFLNAVCNAQPSAVFVQDAGGNIAFANDAAGHLFGDANAQHMIGRSFAAAFGLEDAKAFERAAQAARAAGQPVTAAATLNQTTPPRQGRMTAAVLNREDGGPDQPDSRVILAFDDMTDMIALRAKREASLNQLIAVLTGLIDARDPHSAAHSKSVAHLARRVGTALNYNSDMLRDLEMAALLSNAGKILVPRSVLTKPGALTEEELASVRHALAQTADLLQTVDFDGRVSAILKTKGAPQRAEDAQAAAVIKACNALIGMISPRAHRNALSLDAAIAQLKEASPSEGMDKHVIAALEHVAYNHKFTPPTPA